jgi:predicted nuclease of predicted toxin-antitoxin system
MLKLLVDMNLSSKLADRLCESGYDCRHWKEVGNPQAPDTELFDWARRNGAVVITRDIGFGNILAITNFDTPSVMLIRSRDSFSVLVFPMVIQALKQTEEQLRQGALVVVTENRLRIRMLPFKPDSTNL